MQRNDYGMGDLGEHGTPEPPANADETPMTEEGGGATSVFIPASLYSNKEFREGDEIVLRVTRVDDDGLEAEYASEPGGEDDKPTPVEEPPTANAMIDQEASRGGNGVSSY